MRSASPRGSPRRAMRPVARSMSIRSGSMREDVSAGPSTASARERGPTVMVEETCWQPGAANVPSAAHYLRGSERENALPTANHRAQVASPLGGAEDLPGHRGP